MPNTNDLEEGGCVGGAVNVKAGLSVGSVNCLNKSPCCRWCRVEVGIWAGAVLEVGG